MATSLILAVGLAAAGYGAYKQYQGSKEVAAATRDAANINKNTEQLRQQQMNLDATRRRREVVRQALAARAASLAAVTFKGAGGDGSSALGGAYGGISGQSNVNDVGIRQNQSLGNSIFSNNASLQDVYYREAAAKSQVATGQALSSFGGAMLSNMETIGRVGTNLFGSFKTKSYA